MTNAKRAEGFPSARLECWSLGLLAGFGELGVEDDLRWREVLGFDVGAAFGGSVLAVHAAVFPFHGEGAAVVDVVEGADDLLEIDVAATDGLEVPVALGLVEIDVTTEDSGVMAEIPGDVLHVDVEDAVGEFVDELGVIDALVTEVGGVVVEPEGGMVIDGLEGALCGADVEGDLSRMDFEGILDAELLILVEDGGEALGEVFVSRFDLAGEVRRE